MDHQHVGLEGIEADRVEILVGIERHLAIEDLVVGQHTGRGDQEGVAVGWRCGHGGTADIAAGAALVLDHAGCLELDRELLAQQPRQHVGRAACRKRHDEADGLAGPVLRRRLRRANDGGDRDEEQFQGSHVAAPSEKRAMSATGSGPTKVSTRSVTPAVRYAARRFGQSSAVPATAKASTKRSSRAVAGEATAAAKSAPAMPLWSTRLTLAAGTVCASVQKVLRMHSSTGLIVAIAVARSAAATQGAYCTSRAGRALWAPQAATPGGHMLETMRPSARLR